MGQPYSDERLDAKYLIHPGITKWLNDKNHIKDFVPPQHRAPELTHAQNGEDFLKINGETLTYPCVVKVSTSSSGNGVRICRSPQEFKHVQEEF